MAAKCRLPLMQALAAAFLALMGLVMVYMYCVIDRMHREQQAMRLQLAELQGLGYTSAGAFEKAPRPDFLPVPVRAVEQPVQSAFPTTLEESRPSQSSPTQPRFHELHRGGLSSVAAGSKHDPRKLAGIFSTGRSAGVGCFELDNAAVSNLDVSSATACNSNACPDCFVTPSTLSQAVTLTIQACSTAQWIRSTTRTGIWMYTIINTHATHTVSVTDNSASPTTYNVPPSSFVQAYCASSLGTSNKLYFPSTTLPTLTVDSGITMSGGNFDASASAGTFSTSSGAVTINGATTISGSNSFATGSGAVSLNGATTVADSTAFTVGSSGSGGATTLYGNVNIGSSTAGHSVATAIYGDVTQHDDGLTGKTFTTGSGAVTLSGDVSVASGKNLHMNSAGAGSFQTGTGSVSLNGNVVITDPNTFTTGSGAISLRGDTTVVATKTFTVGTSGSAGASTFYGAVTVGSSTVGDAADLTLYGSFAQNDDGLTLKTFSTATGAVSLNGDTTVGSNKNLHMTGTGTFQTGSGAVTLAGDVTISGAKTFTSGSGQVSLQGAVQIADTIPLSVGNTAGSGGSVKMYGDVTIGDSFNGAATSLDVYGSVTFHDDGNGLKSTLTSASGAVTLNGDTSVAANKNLHMGNTGTGSFQTGTGTVTINGDTTVVSGKTFRLGDYNTGAAIVCNHDNTNTAPTNDLFCKASR